MRGIASDRPGNDTSLIIGVLNRFKPDRRAIGKTVSVGRSIAERENIGQTRAPLCVYQHTIAALGTRRN